MKAMFTTRQSLLAIGLLLVCANGAVAAQRTWFLASQRSSKSVDRVTATLEVGGKTSAIHDGESVSSELNVVGNFQYDERTLLRSKHLEAAARALRHYERAEANIQVGNQVIKPTLGPEHRRIAVHLQSPELTLYCPSDTLTRAELDLIDLQANTLLLDYLLPARSVGLKQTWTHAPELIQLLLGLDAVAEAKVESTLASVTRNIALVEISGNVEGGVGGVSTTIQIKAKYQFDVQRGRIVWFGILIQEKRDVGHVQQGLDVVARLQMSIRPTSAGAELGSAAVASVPAVPSAGLTMLCLESGSGEWILNHDRRWCVTLEDDKQTVLRLVDRGELVAQCHVTNMPQTDPAKMETLEEFQDEIREALSENSPQVTYAGQRENENGYREYRIIVDGAVEDLPIRWIYYLLTDESGRQAILAFLVEGSLIEQFAEGDVDLAANFQFTAPVEAAAAPTPAGPKR